MPHIINESYLYTESGSGFTQRWQTLLRKNENSNFMHLINQVMGYIFEKLKISAKRLTMLLCAFQKFSSTDQFKTCDFGLNSCLFNTKNGDIFSFI